MVLRKNSDLEQPPILLDELSRMENILPRKPPAEIEDLASKRLFYLSALSEETQPEVKLERTQEPQGWSLNFDPNIIVGQLGKKEELVETPALEKGKLQLTDLHRPEWAGVIYHPKMASSIRIKMLRRRNGNRVIPHYIFGQDDRVVFYPSGYPWHCTGKLHVWSNPSTTNPQWTGTGALVGPNIVLTASHVMPWGSSPWMVKFIPAYYDGVSLLGTSIYSYVQTYRGYRHHNQGDDMAILKLYTPLGNSLGWYGTRTYNDDWEDGYYWTKVGYPGAIASAQRPSRITYFPIIDDDSDGAGIELEYKADSSGGDSGGPVFGWWSAGPYAIGAHSGGESEYHFPFSIVRNNVAAGGNALTSLVRWGLDHW